MGDKSAAVRAIKATIALDVAARTKLEQVIARKTLQGADVDQERADIAELNTEIGDARNLLAEVEAANVVVSAPTADEIAEVTRTEQTIRALAVKDAMSQAGLDLIRKGIEGAGQLSGKVKV
jgi:hypothetical protein